MSYVKTPQEVQKIIKGGKLIGEILQYLAQMVKPGVSAWEIDAQAEKMILEIGGAPSFKGYKSHSSDLPFPSTICASINEELVHGVATKDKILKEGDIFSIDIGMQYPANGGYFTDTSLTVPVGEIPEKTKQLLNVTKKALEIGIAECQAGNTIADIGKAVEAYVKPQGYGIVRDLVGHGVGHEVHEEPRIPNFYDKSLENWILEENVVIAIEPMITLGSYEIETAEDGWSISTVDKSLCAHFEHTVVITEGQPIVVTRRHSEL